MTFAKPDLHGEIAREAELGPTDVQVCGPGRMIEATRQSVRSLTSVGFDILLGIHDPDL